jgi:hypothetical protein
MAQMKLRTSQGLLLFDWCSLTLVAAQTNLPSSIPHLEKRGAVTQLTVDRLAHSRMRAALRKEAL